MIGALFLLALLLVGGSAQGACPAGQTCTVHPAWVNIKDPTFGAAGNGTTDDTAAIQAAIDYAFAHNLSAVYCPAGNYKTSSTIYLDPPNDMRQNFSAPPNSGQFTMAFFGDPSSSAVHLSGCLLKPNFNNSVAFIVGPGNGMRASDLAVVGPAGGYRGLQDQAGVGIGIAGAPAGATGTLIENTYVANFYTLYETNVNDACCLSDSSTFRKDSGQNGYYGILLTGTQSFINDIVEPYLEEVTIGVDDRYSHQINIFDGNISAGAAHSNTFSMSSTSGWTSSGGCASPPNGVLCFNTVIGTAGVPPDAFWGTTVNPTPVYNSFVLSTPNFGLIPLTLLAWNATTNVASFALWAPWMYANYGVSFDFSSGLQTDIGAATTLYASERVEVVRGMGVTMNGLHIENSQACTSLFVPADVWAGQPSNEIRNIYFNYDISGVNTNFSQADTYCQQAFPFIGSDQSFSTNAPRILIKGGNWYQATQPVIIDLPLGMDISGQALSLPAINLRVYDQYGMSYGQIPQTVSIGGGDPTNNYNFATVARGGGRWDNDYFLPVKSGYLFPRTTPEGSQVGNLALRSELTGDFCGYEPCPDRTPNLSPTLYALVCPGMISGGTTTGSAISCSGSLGALGTYPPIACRTLFKSLDWSTTTNTAPGNSATGPLFRRSASCPGYSYGQNLTNTLVGGTITYSSEFKSNVLYLDASTIKWMFPGLGMTIGDTSDKYTVTGVYPYLGYITVIGAATDAGGTLLHSYSCTSGCTIEQAPFAWTAY